MACTRKRGDYLEKQLWIILTPIHHSEAWVVLELQTETNPFENLEPQLIDLGGGLFYLDVEF